jgi:putative inorganic carbon (hco3(-)) transporter
MTEYFFIGLILILPFQFALNAGDNIDLVITRVLVPVIFFMWIARGLSKKEIWLPNKAETWLILLFVGISSSSLVLGRDWEMGIRKLMYLLTIFPVYFVAADIVRNKDFQIKAVRAIVISGALAAVTGLIQFVLPFLIGLNATLKTWKNIAPYFLGNFFGKIVTTNPSWLVNISGETKMRAFGFFPDPHTFSFFVSLSFFVAIGYFFWEKKTIFRIMSSASAILALLTIMLSFSRGAYLGVLVGAIFFSIIYLSRSGYLGKVLIVLGIVVAVLSLLYSSSISRRLASSFNPKEGSNIERMKNWKEAADIISDYPLSGVGLGNYAVTVDSTAEDRSSIYAHNLFLDIAAETGILNALVFFCLILISIWRNIWNKDMLSLGLAAGLVYFLIHGVFDTPIWSPQGMVLLLVMLAMGASRLKVKNEKIKVAV